MKFVNVDASGALDTFVDKHSRSLIRRIEKKSDRYKLAMAVKADGKRPDGRVKAFTVSGELRIHGLKNLRAKKTHADVKTAVLCVIEALEKQFRRDSEKRERSRSTLGKSMKKVRQVKWEFARNSIG